MRFLLVVALAFAALPVDACTIIDYPKVKYDPYTRAFTGIVVGIAEDSTRLAGWEAARYIDEFLFDQEKMDSLWAIAPKAGLVLVQPDPTPGAGSAPSVQSIYLDSGCNSGFPTVASLQAEYSIGEQVIVIARPTGAWDGMRGIRGTEPLVIEFPNGGLASFSGFDMVFTGPEVPQRYDRTVEAEWPRRYIEALRREFDPFRAGERARLWPAFRALELRLELEYERDLRHLALASSTRQRTALLLKIRSYSALHFEHYRYEGVLSDCAYARLVDHYLPGNTNRLRMNALLLSYGFALLSSPSECAAFTAEMDERERLLEELEAARRAEREEYQSGPD